MSLYILNFLLFSLTALQTLFLWAILPILCFFFKQSATFRIHNTQTKIWPAPVCCPHHAQSVTVVLCHSVSGGGDYRTWAPEVIFDLTASCLWIQCNQCPTQCLTRFWTLSCPLHLSRLSNWPALYLAHPFGSLHSYSEPTVATICY